jgi:hypothetical protein
MKKKILDQNKLTHPNPSLVREGLIIRKSLHFYTSDKIFYEKSPLRISPSLFKRRIRMSFELNSKVWLLICFTFLFIHKNYFGFLCKR